MHPSGSSDPATPRNWSWPAGDSLAPRRDQHSKRSRNLARIERLTNSAEYNQLSASTHKATHHHSNYTCRKCTHFHLKPVVHRSKRHQIIDTQNSWLSIRTMDQPSRRYLSEQSLSPPPR